MISFGFFFFKCKYFSFEDLKSVFLNQICICDSYFKLGEMIILKISKSISKITSVYLTGRLEFYSSVSSFTFSGQMQLSFLVAWPHHFGT